MSKPAAIIAKLEDCPPWLDRSLVKAYWEADYYLHSLLSEQEEPLLFRFDTPSPELERQLNLLEIQSFAIVTAFNPRSVLLRLEENIQRNAELQERLLPLCRMLRPSVGQSAGGDWQEQGFWALDIELPKAVDIGRAFDQSAIVCWKRGAQVALWFL